MINDSDSLPRCVNCASILYGGKFTVRDGEIIYMCEKCTNSAVISLVDFIRE